MGYCHEIMTTVQRSLHRRLVEDALAERGTTLEHYIDAGKERGKSVADIHHDLQTITGVPFNLRTLYRWLAA